MAKTDVQIEEWAVRRVIKTLFVNSAAEVLMSDYNTDRWDPAVAFSKDEIESLALSFMQLREECAGVCDKEAAFLRAEFIDKQNASDKEYDFEECRTCYEYAEELATDIRNLHTNG